ncbi:putative sulfite sensitivity protein [Scheffersomyces xylosifermentans]|uniref:putative sulfite sensitivity protein n=1 Tax=Scheffersomyces xylosifermentans TaxID=1304137 RepID=UPI00315DEB20
MVDTFTNMVKRDGNIIGEKSSLSSDEGDRFIERLTHLLKFELIDNFTPAYFSSVIGVAISANILHQFPFPSYWLKVLGVITGSFAIFLFVLTTTMFILNCCYHPEMIARYHYKPENSMFMATFVMAFITVVNFIHYILGGKYRIFVWVLWWIGVFITLYSSFILFFFTFFSKLNKEICLRDIDPTIFLLPVPLVVAASCGHLISESLPSLYLQIVTEIVSFILWSFCFCLGLMLLPVVFARMILHKLPETSSVFAIFLPIGFVGQLSYSIAMFGWNMVRIIPDTNLAQIFGVCCGMTSMVLMSFGFFNTFLAIASVFSKIKPFAKNPNPGCNHERYGYIRWNKSAWSMNFPIGTMSLSTFENSRGLVGGYEIKFFKYLSCIYGVALFLITIYNLCGMFHYIYKRAMTLFTKTSRDREMV